MLFGAHQLRAGAGWFWLMNKSIVMLPLPAVRLAMTLTLHKSLLIISW
jgi:hypothetical protein